MLVDIVRFNRQARRLVSDGDDGGEDSVSLADFLAAGSYSPRFCDEFLVPLGASIWSADPETFLDFPAPAYCRFMDNHGLLELRGMPTWRTVTGGSQQYVKALLARLRRPVRTNAAVTKVVRSTDPDRPLGTAVEIVTASHGPETFDAIVLAGHSDQSLELLGDPTPAEREVLGAIRYQPNLATLHTDSSLLPRAPRARASWNYHLGVGSGREATLTYWMNRLQSIDSRHDFLVTLNRPEEIDRTTVLAEFEYQHPVFDVGAMAAQRRRAEIQGDRGTFFAGAYWGYGFHEDGVVSGSRRLSPLRRPGCDRRSHLHRARLRHRRFAPKQHSFRAPLYLLLLDHDELDRPDGPTRVVAPRPRAVVADPVPALPTTSTATRTRRSATAVRDLVEARTGSRPLGAVRTLTQVRTEGYVFNPITVHYCLAPGDERAVRPGLEVVVLEVTNTPWKERHCYVVDARPGPIRATLPDRSRSAPSTAADGCTPRCPRPSTCRRSCPWTRPIA